MASFAFPDVWTWIHNLPPIIQWKTESISLCICPSCSSQPQLKLAITKSLQSYSSVTLSILADYNVPISLWISKPFNLNFNNSTETISNLLLNFIEDVLNYCPNKNLSLFKRIPILDSNLNYKEMFNFSFLTLTFIICIYEAPSDLRSGCLNILKNLFSCPQSRQVSKMLMRILGSNVEEQWMRTINLAITNWISEIKSEHHHHSLLLKSPSPLFSYSNPGFGFWKVQLYCPVIAMEVESSSSSHISAADDRLMFSLNYHQLEGVIQLNYKVIVREKWIEVNVNTDNIRFIFLLTFFNSSLFTFFLFITQYPARINFWYLTNHPLNLQVRCYQPSKRNTDERERCRNNRKALPIKNITPSNSNNANQRPKCISKQIFRKSHKRNRHRKRNRSFNRTTKSISRAKFFSRRDNDNEFKAMEI